MKHYSTFLYRTSLLLSLSNFLHSVCFRIIQSSSSSFHTLSEHLHFSFFCFSKTLSFMAPNAEVQDIVVMTSSHSKVHSLKAAVFHTLAYKLSLEINNKITPKSFIAFLKVLYNVANIKQKRITFEQYSRIHVAGPKIAICETASNVVFVLNSSFTSKDQYFHVALQEATEAFNDMLRSFGYTQKLEINDPHQHQAHPPQQHPLYN